MRFWCFGKIRNNPRQCPAGRVDADRGERANPCFKGYGAGTARNTVGDFADGMRAVTIRVNDVDGVTGLYYRAIAMSAHSPS
jgi:hypothetical protein